MAEGRNDTVTLKPLRRTYTREEFDGFLKRVEAKCNARGKRDLFVYYVVSDADGKKTLIAIGSEAHAAPRAFAALRDAPHLRRLVRTEVLCASSPSLFL